MTSTMPGGGAHAMVRLSPGEMQAAQNALAKLKQSGSLGSHLSGTLESATVSSAMSRTLPGTLGTPTLIHGQGSDTFIGGARGSAPGAGLSAGTDTVVSGSAKMFGGQTHVGQSISEHGPQHFSLSTDTINVAGATAASVKAEHPQETTSAHTVTLGDKTTITIAGLSPKDITKLHH